MIDEYTLCYLPFDDSVTYDECNNTWKSYTSSTTQPTIYNTEENSKYFHDKTFKNQLHPGGGLKLTGITFSPQKLTVSIWIWISKPLEGSVQNIYQYIYRIKGKNIGPGNNYYDTFLNEISLLYQPNYNKKANHLLTLSFDLHSTELFKYIPSNRFEKWHNITFCIDTPDNKNLYKREHYIFIDGKQVDGWSKVFVNEDYIKNDTWDITLGSQSNSIQQSLSGYIKNFEISNIARNTGNIFDLYLTFNTLQLFPGYGELPGGLNDIDNESDPKDKIGDDNINKITVNFPFDINFIDECDNIWSIIGTPIIANCSHIADINGNKLFDKAAYFDGKSYFENVGFTFGSDDFTIQFWAVFTTSTSYAFRIESISDSKTPFIRISNKTISTNSSSEITYSPECALNIWNNITLCYNHSKKKVYFYLNGKKIITLNTAYNKKDTYHIRVGRSHAYFTGYLKHFRFYSSVCLYDDNDYIDIEETYKPITHIINEIIDIVLAKNYVINNNYINNAATNTIYNKTPFEMISILNNNFTTPKGNIIFIYPSKNLNLSQYEASISYISNGGLVYQCSGNENKIELVNNIGGCNYQILKAKNTTNTNPYTELNFKYNYGAYITFGTLEFWTYINFSDNIEHIIFKLIGTDEDYITLNLSNTSWKIIPKFNLDIDNSSYIKNGNETIKNTWTHIAISFTGTYIDIFINGKKITQIETSLFSNLLNTISFYLWNNNNSINYITNIRFSDFIRYGSNDFSITMPETAYNANEDISITEIDSDSLINKE